MKLMTQALEKKIPALYSQENNSDPTVVAHFFNPYGMGDWYITEGSRQEDDYIMFGLCCLFDSELGYVALSELQSVKLPLGLGIERDLYWTPKPLSEVEK